MHQSGEKRSISDSLLPFVVLRALHISRAMEARGISYGRAGVRIITWLISRSNREFLSAQPLTHLSLPYIAVLNFLTEIRILLGYVEKITKWGVARPKFLISFSSTTVSCKKIITCNNFTQFLFMFTLKLQQLKLPHSQIWLWKQLGKNCYPNATIWNVREGKQKF